MFQTSPASGASSSSSLTPDPHLTSPGLTLVYQCLNSTERPPQTRCNAANRASQMFNRGEQALLLNCWLHSCYCSLPFMVLILFLVSAFACNQQFFISNGIPKQLCFDVMIFIGNTWHEMLLVKDVTCLLWVKTCAIENDCSVKVLCVLNNSKLTGEFYTVNK